MLLPQIQVIMSSLNDSIVAFYFFHVQTNKMKKKKSRKTEGCITLIYIYVGWSDSRVLTSMLPPSHVTWGRLLDFSEPKLPPLFSGATVNVVSILVRI